jgi:histone-lysine N-methyltransferase SETMAR
MINSPKAMIIRFWSPLSFPVIQALPPNMPFTAKFFLDNILSDIVASKPACDPYRQRVLHLDNAFPHRAVLTGQQLEENGIVANPCPALSPDLAPFDFFLFAALKGQLTGRAFEPADELIEDICAMMSAIPGPKLEKVFLDWEETVTVYRH